MRKNINDVDDVCPRVFHLSSNRWGSLSPILFPHDQVHMQTQAVSRSASALATRTWNPSAFNAEALELMKENPQLAARSMTQLAMHKRTAERELNLSTESTNDLVAFAVSSGMVALIGMWEGNVLAKRDAIIEGWELNGDLEVDTEPSPELWKAKAIPEPGKLGPIPMGLILPVLFGIGSVIAASRRDEREPASTAERVLATTATTTFGLWIANMTRAVGYRREKADLLAKTVIAETGT